MTTHEMNYWVRRFDVLLNRVKLVNDCVGRSDAMRCTRSKTGYEVTWCGVDYASCGHDLDSLEACIERVDALWDGLWYGLGAGLLSKMG